MAQFSLAWDGYKQNICQGLSTLQQNGEFVDMTIAASGHHVKVHQMVMSLASPYIKELVLAAQCPHPVIFLNKVSYTVLCAILEYIYVGEVIIDQDYVTDLIEAGKELHIKGLEELSISPDIESDSNLSETMLELTNSGSRVVKKESRKTKNVKISIARDENQSMEALTESDNENFDTQMDTFDTQMDTNTSDIDPGRKTGNLKNKSTDFITDGDGNSQITTNEDTYNIFDTSLAYTISNMGSVQLILNRNLYFLKYKSKQPGGHCRWKCATNRKEKYPCPATVVTRGGVILKRLMAHNHPFQDKKILRKVRDGAVFSSIQEAQLFGARRRGQLDALPDVSPPKGKRK